MKLLPARRAKRFQCFPVSPRPNPLNGLVDRHPLPFAVLRRIERDVDRAVRRVMPFMLQVFRDTRGETIPPAGIDSE